MKGRLAMLVALAGISGYAAADTEFKELDVNADGFIDSAEAAALAPLAEAFFDVDEDKDGKVNPEEYEKFEEQQEPPDKGG